MEKEIINEMNKCLENTSIDERFICFQNVSITQNGIVISSSSNMHQIIEDYVYPPIKTLDVYHYTDNTIAEDIKESNKFRLYNILKRYREGELSPFLHKFGFEKAFDIYGQLKEIESYKNIFYGSFIEAPSDNLKTNEMEYFDSLCETRLKFRITSSKGFFRKINYENDKCYTLFLNLKKVAEKYDKKFLIEGMSGRFASFCIDDSNNIENEYRAYWRHWSECDGFIVNKDENENFFIEIDLNKENFSGIKIELISQ